VDIKIEEREVFKGYFQLKWKVKKNLLDVIIFFEVIITNVIFINKRLRLRNFLSRKSNVHILIGLWWIEKEIIFLEKKKKLFLRNRKRGVRDNIRNCRKWKLFVNISSLKTHVNMLEESNCGVYYIK